MLCPLCGKGTLVASNHILICPTCDAVHRKGWVRGVVTNFKPDHIMGIPVGQGPLFATLQSWTKSVLEKDLNSTPYMMDFVLDLDFADFQTAVQAAQHYAETLKHEPVKIFFSGSKGFHFFIPHIYIYQQPLPGIEEVYRRLAQLIMHPQFPVDFAVYGRRRMFRVPNTRHEKTGLYKIQLKPEEIPYARDLAKSPRPLFKETLSQQSSINQLFTTALRTPSPPPAPVSHISFTPPCIQTLLHEGPTLPGTRHTLYLQMATFMLQSGRSESEFFDWAAQTPGTSKSSLQERVQDAKRVYQWVNKHRPRFRCSIMQQYGLCSTECPINAR